MKYTHRQEVEDRYRGNGDYGGDKHRRDRQKAEKADRADYERERARERDAQAARHEYRMEHDPAYREDSERMDECLSVIGACLSIVCLPVWFPIWCICCWPCCGCDCSDPIFGTIKESWNKLTECCRSNDPEAESQNQVIARQSEPPQSSMVDPVPMAAPMQMAMPMGQPMQMGAPMAMAMPMGVPMAQPMQMGIPMGIAMPMDSNVGIAGDYHLHDVQ